MTNRPQPFKTRHKQAVARASAKVYKLGAVHNKFKEWVNQLPQNAPRSRKDWHELGFFALMLLIEANELRHDIQTDLAEIKEIIDNAKQYSD